MKDLNFQTRIESTGLTNVELEVTRYNSVMMFNMRNDYEDRAYSDVCK